MTSRLFIPCDAGALAVGAEEVAAAMDKTASGRGLDVEIVRTGSRGLYWLEPMVEVETPAGRVAFGPVAQGDAESVLEAAVTGATHPLRLGLTEEIPWLKRQTRLTFARCGVAASSVSTMSAPRPAAPPTSSGTTKIALKFIRTMPSSAASATATGSSLQAARAKRPCAR